MTSVRHTRADAHARALRLSLITTGDAGSLTGGHLYHRRLAELAPASDAHVRLATIENGRAFLDPRVGQGAFVDALRGPPDAVLLDSLAAASMAANLAIRRPNVPIVGLLHQRPGGIEGNWLRRRARARLDLVAWGRAALLVATGAGLAEGLVAMAFPADRVRVVPPGHDMPPPARAPSRRELRLGTGTALLTVANWLPHKGIAELLDAFATLPMGSAHLHLVGATDRDRRYRRRIEHRLRDPRIAGRVTVHGSVPREELAGLYAGADVFVLPSRVESYGIVYAEAMSAGLPVVAWASGNVPTLARDGIEGIIARPGDVARLADAIDTLARDEALRRRLGEAARRRAASLPTWRDTAAAVVSVVREAIALTAAGRET